jgi:Fur family transcriptional regulator, zinc uptake regulator
MNSDTHAHCTACEAPDTAFHPHDHADCRANVLTRADELARTSSARMTPVRRRVLEILLAEHRALGAYDVLQHLAADGFGNQPPVAYRALEFLVEHGFAHRIDRLNAFVACMHPGEAHAPAFLICRNCRTVAEAPAKPARAALNKAAASLGFQVEGSSIEAVGLCPQCKDAA